jgi:hypothetical protein
VARAVCDAAADSEEGGLLCPSEGAFHEFEEGAGGQEAVAVVFGRHFERVAEFLFTVFGVFFAEAVGDDDAFELLALLEQAFFEAALEADVWPLDDLVAGALDFDRLWCLRGPA